MEDLIDKKSAQVGKVDSTTIKTATLGQLAKGVLKLQPRGNTRFAVMAEGEEKPAFEANLMALLTEISLRTGSTAVTKKVEEILPAMAMTHNISVVKGADPVVTDMKGEVVKTEVVSGHVMPVTYPHYIEKAVMTTLANAAYFPIFSKQLEHFSEIDQEAANTIKFPYISVNKADIPIGKLSRADFLDYTISRMMRDIDYAQDIFYARIPESIKFDFEKGLFQLPSTPVLEVDSLKKLYLLIDMHRKVRGADTGAGYLALAGYYFGFGTRGLYKTMYTLQDIEAMGHAMGVNMLEINGLDDTIDEHVISSLVSSGWKIRVAGSNIYPEREKKENSEEYVLDRGVFRYFATYERYLRYVRFDDPGFKVAAGVVTMQEKPGSAVMRLFNYVASETAIPYTTMFLNDDMLEMSKNYPNCSLFPSAHAHNGHVNVIRADVVNNQKPFDYYLYLKRVAMATTYKTFYVYNRGKFIDRDPYAHTVKFNLQGKALKKIVEKVDWRFENDPLIPDDPDQVFDATPLVKTTYTVKKVGSLAKKQDIIDKGREARKEVKVLESAQRTIGDKISSEKDPDKKEKLSVEMDKNFEILKVKEKQLLEATVSLAKLNEALMSSDRKATFGTVRNLEMSGKIPVATLMDENKTDKVELTKENLYKKKRIKKGEMDSSESNSEDDEKDKKKE